MRRRPPRSTRTDTLFPYATIVRSRAGIANGGCDNFVRSPFAFDHGVAARARAEALQTITRRGSSDLLGLHLRATVEPRGRPPPADRDCPTVDRKSTRLNSSP